MNVERFNPEFERLMDTLPAMLACTMNASAYILRRLTPFGDGNYVVSGMALDQFAVNITALRDRREGHFKPDASGWVLEDTIYVPTYGHPHIGQPVTADEGGDEVDRRTDYSDNLFRERRMLDQLLAIGAEIVGCFKEQYQVRGAAGSTAYRIPSRIRDAISSFYTSPVLDDWRPGELRNIEAIAALNDARGIKAPLPAEIFNNKPIPRLMPRADDWGSLVLGQDYRESTSVVDIEEVDAPGLDNQPAQNSVVVEAISTTSEATQYSFAFF